MRRNSLRGISFFSLLAIVLSLASGSLPAGAAIRGSVTPLDGSWTGDTSRSQPMSFTVQSSGTQWTMFKLKTTFDFGYCSGSIEKTISGPGTISAGQLSWSDSHYAFTATFDTSVSAHGTYVYKSQSTGPGCPNLTQSGTWTATVEVTYFCGSLEATIWGTDGNDTLVGTAGRDVIAGLGGNDTISGLGDNDVICGGPGNDTIKGGGGGDLLYGDAGDDTLDGGGGNDTLLGGAGSDVLVPGSGTDTVNGGLGVDTVSYLRAVAAVVVDLAAGTVTGGGAGTFEAVENVDGSRYGDAIRGSASRNLLRGLGGDDTLEGRGGDDQLLGGPGTDTARGGAGTDICVADNETSCEL